MATRHQPERQHKVGRRNRRGQQHRKLHHLVQGPAPAPAADLHLPPYPHPKQATLAKAVWHPCHYRPAIEIPPSCPDHNRPAIEAACSTAMYWGRPCHHGLETPCPAHHPDAHTIDRNGRDCGHRLPTMSLHHLCPSHECRSSRSCRCRPMTQPIHRCPSHGSCLQNESNPVIWEKGTT